jgi:uncharacterized protein
MFLASFFPGPLRPAPSTQDPLRLCEEQALHMSVAEEDRIESLDVLRGFALLGILLLHILGFGLHSGAYSFPGLDVTVGWNANLLAWVSIDLLAEGAMRCLFSILFGAGVLLFTNGASGKRWRFHYSRMFWLLGFGLFDAYLLLWNGDILVTYAVAGALLYWLRNAGVRTLLVIAAVLILLMSGIHGLMKLGLAEGQAAAAKLDVISPKEVEDAPHALRSAAQAWRDFSADYLPTPGQVEAELTARRGSYATAFKWNAGVTNEMLAFVIPVFLLWDALAMMIIGMALYRAGVLQGRLPTTFYVRMMVVGFFAGLSFNVYEVTRAIANDLDLFYVFGQMQWTYHFGRLGMALGYLCLVVWLCKAGVLARGRRMLAAVGRMALTNYLMHSLICAIVFTGVGFALVGELSRPQLYLVVVAIWVFQLRFSTWWLRRYSYGPVEWLWRALTYGQLPGLIRSSQSQVSSNN